MRINNIWEHVSKWTDSKGGLIFILCLSAFLKILALVALSDKAINPDGVIYISAAQQFASGHFKQGLSIYPMPLYPLLITFIHFLIPNWVLAARFISSAALVLALIPLYLLTKDLFNRKIAFWACLAATLAPEPNGWAVEVIRGPAFILIFAWAVYFAQRAVRSAKRTDFLLAAFFAWVSIFFRIEGIIFIPFYLFFLVGLAIWKAMERGPFLNGIIIWIAFPLCFILIGFVASGAERVASFNRIDQVMQEVQNLFHLKFLDNYHHIYQQLKVLEDSSPYTGLGKQNLVAIARHYMPIIYLLGLLEGYIKVLFPFFVIPLFWGFRCSLLRARVLVLALVIFYLLMVYYYVLKMDFVRTRFLFAPAFLLYPWVGAGLERIFTFLEQASKPKFLAAVFVIFFIISPLGKVVHSFGKHDDVIIRTGEWLAAQPKFKTAKIATNEARILFYAGKESWSGGRENFLPYARLRYDYKEIGQLARKRQRDLVIIRSSVKRKDKVPDPKYFQKVKEFIGKKSIAIVYCSPQFLKARH